MSRLFTSTTAFCFRGGQPARRGNIHMKRNATILITTLSLLIFCFTDSRANNPGDSPTNLKPGEATLSYVTRLKLKADDLRQLASGEAVARGLSSDNDKAMAGLGVVVTDAPPDVVAEVYRSLAMFEQGSDTLAYGKFSSEPQLKDLDGLTIDDKDLLALLKCQVNNSELKLSEKEIASVRAAVGSATRLTPQVKARLTAEYKKLLVERVRNYLAGGASAWGEFADKEESVSAHKAFATLVREQADSAAHCDHLYRGLLDFPATGAGEFESFVYWAKQKFGKLKPVISLTQVFLHRDGERIFIASKQLYTSHYTEAGLGVAELIPTFDAEGQRRTVIAYTLRLQVDMLGGKMNFLSRRMAQPKMLAKLKESLKGLRVALEARHAATP